MDMEKHVPAIAEMVGFEFNPLSWESIMRAVEWVEEHSDEINGRLSVEISGRTCTVRSERFRPNEQANRAYCSDATGRTKKTATVAALGNYANWHRVNIRKSRGEKAAPEWDPAKNEKQE